MPEPNNIYEIFCSEDGAIWYGLKKNWRNKRRFAKEVKAISDNAPYELRPITKLVKAVESIHLTWCSCGPGCDFDGQHVIESEAGLSGYRLDLDKADKHDRN